ncbi:hypothetical protein N658DRAFT_126214 [Parathielavia hyrcaniae]|uniref:Uncharacterized protein n=1 Tax=Parathielavia hyrcaniae TaxID=113614 RepID=A0AAN6T5M3_9PEZI|nr:hypothetical protein N658DRAFT_126214 [Parathielavia hyrcaniae]
MRAVCISGVWSWSGWSKACCPCFSVSSSKSSARHGAFFLYCEGSTYVASVVHMHLLWRINKKHRIRNFNWLIRIQLSVRRSGGPDTLVSKY